MRSPSVTGCRPIDQCAHAGTQALHPVDRFGPHREGPQIDISGGLGRAPVRVAALDIDRRDRGGHRVTVLAQGGDAHLQRLPDLQPSRQVLAQVEGEPRLIHIDDGDQRCTGAEQLADLGGACGHLAADRRDDGHPRDPPAPSPAGRRAARSPATPPCHRRARDPRSRRVFARPAPSPSRTGRSAWLRPLPAPGSSRAGARSTPDTRPAPRRRAGPGWLFRES